MKRCVCLALVALVLCGCQSEETLETVNDEWIVPVMAQPRELALKLPEDAALPVLEQEDRRLYMGEDYEIMLETLASGDLDATIRNLCGYDRDALTVISSNPQGLKRYDFVWTAAGEGGDRIGRAVILDDGTYHYTMTVLRSAESVEQSQIVWRSVFESFTLA